MKRVTIVLSVFLGVFMAVPAGAQPAPRAEVIELTSPADDGTVTSVAVDFVWQEAMVVEFVFKLKSADGKQTHKVVLPNDICVVNCAYHFDPFAHDWEWREDAVYKWQVKGRDNFGDVSAKSVKSTFITDVLPDILLGTPPNGHVATVGSGVPFVFDFTWSAVGHDVYRIVITKQNGKLHYQTSWLDPVSSCVSLFCTVTVPFEAIPAGKQRTFTWRVLGKLSGVKGKAKSAKYTVTFDTSAS